MNYGCAGNELSGGTFGFLEARMDRMGQEYPQRRWKSVCRYQAGVRPVACEGRGGAADRGARGTRRGETSCTR